MKTKSRRELITTAALAGAALLTPRAVLAAAGHPRAVDLVVQKIDWSADGGLTWNPEEAPLPGAAILFRATIKNKGLAAARINAPLEVAFRVGGQTVALSNHHKTGLAPGAEVVLEANTGPMDDPFWHDGRPGTQTIQAVVDPNNHFPSEGSATGDGESNRTAEIPLAFDITDTLGVIGGIIGGMVGGPPGAFGGAFVGGMVGGFVKSFNGELPATVGWSTESGGGSGGYFPRQVSEILQDWGADSRSNFEATLRLFGGTSVVALRNKWWKFTNPKIWGGPDGAIADMKGVRKVVLAYAYLHRHQMSSEGNGPECDDMRLYGDGFYDQNGNPTAGGGIATDRGCGETRYYTDLCSSVGMHATSLSAVKAAAQDHGFRSTKVRNWRQGLIPMHHASAFGLPANLQPSPTNGKTGMHGLRLLINYIISLEGAFKRRTNFNDWSHYGAARAKVHNVATPLYLAALREFVRLVTKYALSPKNPTGKSQAREELAGWWAEEGLPFVAMGHLSDILDDFLFATGMPPIVMEDVAFRFLDQMAAGDPVENLPRISVANNVYPLVSTKVFPASQRIHFQEVLEVHSRWRRRLLKRRVYVMGIKIVGD